MLISDNSRVREIYDGTVFVLFRVCNILVKPSVFFSEFDLSGYVVKSIFAFLPANIAHVPGMGPKIRID